MDQPLARGAVEQAHRLHTRLGGGIGREALLERSAERGTLRAIADRGGRGLAHILLGRLEIRHD
jgi:hypothetical protein